jgi:hypothetical protein
MKFTGLAQKYPHIDLSKFIGKNVLIRLNCESSYFSHKQLKLIGKVVGEGKSIYINGICFLNSGERAYHNKDKQWITEIYDEDAFHIVTKELPDVDPEVEKAKEAVKNLSEEQIAALLHSLKK